ncbi:MAG: FecR domain-containing protein, partial [Pseudomonadota bacterium]
MAPLTALAACMAIAIAPSIALRIQADHTTATGETRSIGLDDGSVAHLQPESAIAIDFDGTERRVRIVKGGAFFEVAHDASLPFRVAARKVTTTVLGTAFDVRLTDDDTAVAVRRGQVGVARPPEREQLNPGDWIRIDREGSVRRGAVPPDEVGAWMDSQLIARDRPLADVMEEIGGYYGGVIVLTSDTLGNRRVSGVFNLGDPVGALRAME